jgi:hypothetical protein
MQTINLIDYLQFAVSLLGTPINAWMLYLLLGDLRWVRRQGINGRVRRQQIARVRQESLRLTAQLILLWGAIVSVALRPEIPLDGDIAAYETIVLHRSFVMMSVAVLLAVKSLWARLDRDFIEDYEEPKVSLTGAENER